MKNIVWKGAGLTALMTAVFCFSSCQKEEYNSEELVVYLKNVTGDAVQASYERMVYAGDSFEMEGDAQIEHKYQVCASRNLVTDAQVSLSVNAKAVEAYNEKNQTEYELMPESAYTLGAQELTLQAGHMQSAEGLLSVSDLSKLDLSKDYILPISISSVSSDDKGLQVSVNRNTVYVIFDFSVSYIDPEAETVEGEIMDRSAWEISATDHLQEYTANLAFDGDLQTAYINGGANQDDFLNAAITVDMKQTEEIAGFRIYPNNTLFGADVNGKIMRFEISQDGEEWTELGVSGEITLNEWWKFENPVYTYAKLFKPQTARYVRFSWADTYNPARIFISVGEIDIIK